MPYGSDLPSADEGRTGNEKKSMIICLIERMFYSQTVLDRSNRPLARQGFQPMSYAAFSLCGRVYLEGAQCEG
jgi:hypothetical protein